MYDFYIARKRFDQSAPGTADGKARDGMSAGNDMDREPGKPGTGMASLAPVTVLCSVPVCVYT